MGCRMKHQQISFSTMKTIFNSIFNLAIPSSIFSILLCLFMGCNPAEKQDLPNILILVADDAGWEDFGCYGNEFVKTPNLDRLAANGKVADNAFLTIAQCSPSRISILTG